VNATINVEADMYNRRLEPMGLDIRGEFCRLKGTDVGLDCHESAGWVFGLVWQRINPFLRSQSGPLAGYLDVSKM
jgi:hypothetical protein